MRRPNQNTEANLYGMNRYDFLPRLAFTLALSERICNDSIAPSDGIVSTRGQKSLN